MTSISRSATFKFFCDFDLTIFLPLEKLYHKQQYYHIIIIIYYQTVYVQYFIGNLLLMKIQLRVIEEKSRADR